MVVRQVPAVSAIPAQARTAVRATSGIVEPPSFMTAPMVVPRGASVLAVMGSAAA